MAVEKTHTIIYNITAKLDDFTKELRNLEAKIPEVSLKINTSGVNEALKELTATVKKHSTINVEANFREIISGLTDSNVKAEDLYETINKVVTSLKSIDRIKTPDIKNLMAGFNIGEVNKTVKLYDTYLKRLDEAKSKAKSLAESYTSGTGNSLGKLIFDNVYDSSALKNMDAVFNGFSQLSEEYLTASKNSKTAQKNLEDYSKSLVVYRSILESISGFKIDNNTSSNDIKKQIKDIQNLSNVIGTLKTSEQAINSKLGENKANYSAAITSNFKGAKVNINTSSVEYDSYIRQLGEHLRQRLYDNLKANANNAYKDALEYAQSTAEKYMKGGGTKAQKKAMESVSEQLDDLTKKQAEGTAVNIPVNPSIDINRFISDIQAQINAAGKSIEIPVKLSDDVSEVTKQIDTLLSKVGDDAKLSIKLDVPEGNIDNVLNSLTNFKIKNSSVKNIDKLDEALQKLGGTLASFPDASNKALSDLSSLVSRTSELKDLSAIIKSASTVSGKKKLDAVDTATSKSNEANEVDKTVKAYEDLTKKLDSYYKVQQKMDSGRKISTDEYVEFNRLETEISNAIKGLEKYKVESDEAKKAGKAFYDQLDAISETQKTNTKGFYNNILEDFKSDTTRMNNIKGYAEVVNNLENNIKKLDNLKPIDLGTGQELDEWKNLNKEIEESIRQLRTSREFRTVNEGAIGNLQRRLVQFGTANSRLFTDDNLSRQFDEIFEATKKIDNSDAFSNINKQLSEFQMNVMRADKMGRSFGDEWMAKMRSLGVWMASFVSVFDIINMFEQGLTAVKQFDTALTNLAKVADGTSKEIREFGEAGYDIANSIGSTNLALIDASAEWARLGYSLNEIDELGRISTIYANVGELPAAEATSDLVSILKAYNLEAEEALRITDSLNEVGNRYAVSSAELGEILNRSASALNVGGVTFDEAIAMGTGMNEILQDAPRVGTALKTLAMRVRSTKVELAEAGEDTEGAAESISKLREQVLALTNVDGKGGVDILTPDGSAYKNVFQIYREIAAVFDKMNSLDQSALLELLTGKQQAQAGAALLSNWETVEKALVTSQNSMGSAEKENQRYVESIQGQLNILSNKWTQLWTSGISKDTVVFFVQLAQGVLDVANAFGLLQTAVAAVGIGKLIKDFGRPDEGCFLIA